MINTLKWAIDLIILYVNHWVYTLQNKCGGEKIKCLNIERIVVDG